jgi:hypothetical protein
MVSCASFKRLYGSRWIATAASPAGVTVAYTSPAVSNLRVTSIPKSHSIGAPGRAGQGGVVEQENVVAVGPQPGWLRMKGQTFPRAGPHAAPTVPGGTSRRTAAKIARLNLLYVDGDWHVDHSWSPSHDQRGMVRPSGTSSADR